MKRKPVTGNPTPREPLYDRVLRLAKERRKLLLFGLLALVPLYNVISNSLALGWIWMIPATLALVAVGIFFARAVTKRREAAGMAARNVTAQPLHLPTPWAQLNEAVEGYRAVAGEMPPNLGYKRRADVGGDIDAELMFVGRTPKNDGNYPAVSPFDSSDAQGWYVFNEAMLDSFSAAQLLAVMLHFKFRAEFARGESGRLANGVCEADSKTLLLMRDHVALVSAIEGAARRPTPSPDHGIIRFADADLRPRSVGNTGLVTQWVLRDRIGELRTHLGALSLDVAEA